MARSKTHTSIFLIFNLFFPGSPAAPILNVFCELLTVRNFFVSHFPGSVNKEAVFREKYGIIMRIFEKHDRYSVIIPQR